MTQLFCHESFYKSSNHYTLCINTKSMMINFTGLLYYPPLQVLVIFITRFFQKMLVSTSNMMLMVMMNCFLVWLTNERCLALFPAKTIARDPHHRKFPTCCEKGLNLRRTWGQGSDLAPVQPF